ncbi:MAG: hypothetical protein F6K55_22250 [Moorea sp. SIO4A3]|nr:hypothetical protein [Moorena sp. SIO4A3]
MYSTTRIFTDSRLPRCAFRRRIKFATGRTAPDSRFPIPDSRFPIPNSKFAHSKFAHSLFPLPDSLRTYP